MQIWTIASDNERWMKRRGPRDWSTQKPLVEVLRSFLPRKSRTTEAFWLVFSKQEEKRLAAQLQPLTGPITTSRLAAFLKHSIMNCVAWPATHMTTVVPALAPNTSAVEKGYRLAIKFDQPRSF